MKRSNQNPFKPGAGHSPPYLAGRSQEIAQFRRLLQQNVIMQNVVLTGLRGVGKTVLMDDEYKAMVKKEKWVWVGSDLSEAAFVDELALANRLLTDLAVFTSTIALSGPKRTIGFNPPANAMTSIGFELLWNKFTRQSGLASDKLKAVLEFVWSATQATGFTGIVFAYDEAQVVQDRRDKDQYPLALLLETFQSLQRKGMRYLLLLTGLPTLFPKLVESRTYAERMFTVQEVGRLSEEARRDAIMKPLANNTIRFEEHQVELIMQESGGYPYFIQFICREFYEQARIITEATGKSSVEIPLDSVIRKLDADFFAGRWNKVSDRQRELLLSIAALANCDDEFTISEIAEASEGIKEVKLFRRNDVTQMLPRLIEAGLVYKNRHGKYSLAVPLFSSYIRRQFESREPRDGIS